MKREWKAPDIQDLTISSTSTTSMQTCFWWRPGRPGKEDQDMADMADIVRVQKSFIQLHQKVQMIQQRDLANKIGTIHWNSSYFIIKSIKEFSNH